MDNKSSETTVVTEPTVTPSEQLPRTTSPGYDSFNQYGDLGGDIKTVIAPEESAKEVKIDDFKAIIKQRGGELATPEKEQKEKKDDSTTKTTEGKTEKEGGKEVEKKTTEKETPAEKDIPSKDKSSVVEPEKKETPTVEQTQAPTPEDVKSYGESVAGYLKKMSKDAADFVKARIKENTDYRGVIEELKKSAAKPSYMDHELGFTLSPEYQKSVGIINGVSAELGHWRAQFAKIRAGEDWMDLTHDAQGNVIQVKRPADANAEAQVMHYLNTGQMLLQEQRNAMQNISQNFKSNYASKMQEVRGLEDTYFPDLKDKTVFDKNPYTQGMIDMLKKHGLEENILANTLAKYHAFAMAQGEYIKSKESEWEKSKLETQQKALAGPTSGNINNTNGNSAVKNIDNEVVDFGEFNRIKRGF